MTLAPHADPGPGNTAWRDALPPVAGPRGFRDWLRVGRRGAAAMLVLLSGVVLILPLRGVERLFHGRRRPWTGPHVQRGVPSDARLHGDSLAACGRPMRGPGAVVANHSSWLDILVLNAAMPVFFVSKAEVAGWPGINILCRLTDTHFVVRDPRLAVEQAREFAERVRAGHRLLFFPEGTSTDGRRMLPFKPTLFQGFLDPALPQGLAIQPVSAVYDAPRGTDPRFYGWWGDMDLGPHLLAVLSARPQDQ